MKYIFIQPRFHIFLDENPRNTVEMEFVYSHGGSWFEDKEDAGKTHLLEHVVCSGTKDMPFEKFKAFTFENSIKYNAFTSPTCMGLEMSGHKNNFKEMFDVLLEMFTTPTIEKGDLDREKEIVLSEITERKGNPQYRLYYDISKQILTPESFSNHEVLGKSECVAKTDVEDLKRLFKDLQSRSQFVLCISGGGIDEKYVKEKIQNLKLENDGSDNQENVEATKNQSEDAAKNHKNELKNKLLPLPFPFKNELKNWDSESIQHKDGHEECELTFYIPVSVTYENRAVRDVFTQLYLRWSGHGLYDLLRDTHGLIYGYYFSFDNYGQILNIEMNCHLQDVRKIIDLTREFFSDFDTRFNEKQFEALKSQLLIKQDLTKDKLGAEANFAQNILLTYGKIDDYDSLVKELKNVSKEDLRKFFEEVKEGVEKMKILAVSQKEEVKNLFEKFTVLGVEPKEFVQDSSKITKDTVEESHDLEG